MSEPMLADKRGAVNARPRSSRRGFLKAAAATAAGLTIGFHWSGPLSRALADPVRDFTPNAFLRIAPDNSVTVIAKHLEMGQGAYTGLATVVADELDADWAQIRVESAPADASKYANLAFGTMQGTGGSSAMANSWMQLRNAGATARARRKTGMWRRKASRSNAASCITRRAIARRRSATSPSKPRHRLCPTRWR
jgi:isoquinoline 1-oxidoreductase beta subunit